MPPEIPVPVGDNHVYSVPEGIVPLIPFVGVTINAIPLQVVAVILFTMAIGLTVTVSVNELPT